MVTFLTQFVCRKLIFVVTEPGGLQLQFGYEKGGLQCTDNSKFSDSLLISWISRLLKSNGQL